MSLPILKLPSYTIKLPASKKEVKFRPFTVGEEKILLLAFEEADPKGIFDAISTMIKACTYDQYDAVKLPQADIEYLFIQIRNKSLGETADIAFICNSCETKNKFTADLSKIQIIEPKAVSRDIKISDDTWVSMNYPTLDITYSINDTSYSGVLEMIAKCIDTVTNGDTVFVVKENPIEMTTQWVGTMTQKQIDLINEFFQSVPMILFEEKTKCTKCEAENLVRIEGLADFFG